MSERRASERIAIRLDGHEPVRGVVQAGESERAQSFVGWLGLLQALEAALRPQALPTEEELA